MVVGSVDFGYRFCGFDCGSELIVMGCGFVFWSWVVVAIVVVMASGGGYDWLLKFLWLWTQRGSQNLVLQWSRNHIYSISSRKDH